MPPRTSALRIALVSLGCPKNLVDSERAVSAFVDRDLVICPDPADAEVVVVNTCGFLQAAVEESIETISEMVRLKGDGGLKGVVVAGCLTSRNGVSIRDLVPGVDAVVPFADYDRLVSICREAAGRPAEVPAAADYRQDLLTRGDRIPLTPPGGAYLKISDGCNNPCSFCTIPSIKGKHRSAPLDALLAEARELAAGGVKELTIVGQDTTFWGFDLDRKLNLPVLLRSLAEVEGIEWIRLLYAYPAYVTDELLDTIAGTPAILPYLDIPLQHISDKVLRGMKRPLGGRRTRALMGKIRERVPGIVLRTTLITGSPDEGEAEFAELLEYVREFRFERLGVFPYSPEPDTPLGAADHQVPREERERRRDLIMEAQQGIAFEDAQGMIGEVVDCLVEGPPEEGLAPGRTWRDAPEIDGLIAIANAPPPGTIGPVRVTGADGYDLEGVWA
jgi:ribosomal protein S12 methylthiotransferase